MSAMRGTFDEFLKPQKTLEEIDGEKRFEGEQ